MRVEMWCYQKPGFEALILAELQKQQQSSQFCDTLLKADGVSVPAHSCVLSAISPQFSSSLSSSPAAAAGQKRLLEFGALGACTLLHLVRLLYSGEMVGEGEKEKQEVISAAAKLGIHGLVDVSKTDSQRKPRDECLYIEAGVQTESQISEEHQVRLGGWRREVRDGATLLWRERLPIQTQTEDIQMNGASSSQPPVEYETIDLNALQTLGQGDALQIPYVPMSVVYPNEDNHKPGQSSVSAATPSPAIHYSSVQNNVFPIPSQATPYAVETSHWGAEAGRTAVMEEWPEEEFEQFEGNIPGFINYFLNPEKDEFSNRRRGRRRQGAGMGALRQAGTRSRGRPRGRRGGLTQTVDVQDVGVSKLSKMYLQRWGMYANRTGQGGGAVGRMLYVKTREFVKSGRCTQRRKGRGVEWNIDQCTTMLVKAEAGASGKRKRGRPRKEGKPQQQPSPFQRAQRVTKTPPVRDPEEQPEQIDHLLEEVMMGLDILPNNNRNPQVTSSTRRRGTANVCAVQNQRRQTSALTVASGGRQPSSSEAPVMQQPQEGELTDILDQFLDSFERLESEAAQKSTQSTQPHTGVTEYRKNNTQLPMHSPQIHSACPAVTPARPGTSTQSETSENDSPMTSVHKQTKKSSGKGSPAVRRPRRRRDYLFSLEKPRTKSKKTTLSEALKKEEVKQRVSRQLQQMPVVKLERRGALPGNVRVQELNQSPVPRAKRSPSHTLSWGTKTYPIRSRFKEAQITDSNPFLEQPLSDQVRIGKLSKNTPLPFLSQGSSSLSREEERMGTDEDGAEPRASNRGTKRHWDSDEQNSGVEVKRICREPPESIFQTTDAEVIDIETVSLNSTSTTVLTTNSETIDGEVNVAEESASDTDAESDIIDVDSDFGEHAEVICSLRANVVTETSDTEDLDDEVDVTGDSSPAPAPVLISWTDSSESEDNSETNAQEEQTVMLSKGHLVRC